MAVAGGGTGGPMTDIDQLSAADVVARCVAIAEERALATGRTSYADGYRAAAEEIRARIVTLLGPVEPSGFERELRDLRDVEVEARALVRVLELLRRHHARTPSAVARRVLVDVMAEIDRGVFARHDALDTAPASRTRVG